MRGEEYDLDGDAGGRYDRSKTRQVDRGAS